MISNNIDIPKEEAIKLFSDFIDFHPDYHILEENLEVNPNRFKYILKNYTRSSEGRNMDVEGTIEFISTEDGTYYFLEFVSQGYNIFRKFILIIPFLLTMGLIIMNLVTPSSTGFERPPIEPMDILMIIGWWGICLGFYFVLDYLKKKNERKFGQIVQSYIQKHR